MESSRLRRCLLYMLGGREHKPQKAGLTTLRGDHQISIGIR